MNIMNIDPVKGTEITDDILKECRENGTSIIDTIYALLAAQNVEDHKESN